MTKPKSPSNREFIHEYEQGRLESVSPSKGDLKKFKESARGTFIKDRRVNIRLSSPDLMDIQARAAEEGVPYQTLMSSLIHKFVTGQFIAKPSPLTGRSRGRAGKVTNPPQNQAIAHEKWFRRQVELGFAGLEAGNAVGEKEHAARRNKRRASLLKRARGA